MHVALKSLVLCACDIYFFQHPCSHVPLGTAAPAQLDLPPASFPSLTQRWPLSRATPIIPCPLPLPCDSKVSTGLTQPEFSGLT